MGVGVGAAGGRCRVSREGVFYNTKKERRERSTCALPAQGPLFSRAETKGKLHIGLVCGIGGEKQLLSAEQKVPPPTVPPPPHSVRPRPRRVCAGSDDEKVRVLLLLLLCVLMGERQGCRTKARRRRLEKKQKSNKPAPRHKKNRTAHVLSIKL